MKKHNILGFVFLAFLLLTLGSAFASVPVDDIVAYYKLDETSGTTASDATGNGNTGTANNARVFTSNTGTSGIINSGADFTQGDDSINLNSDLGFVDGDPITMALWINPTTVTTVSGTTFILGNYERIVSVKGLFVGLSTEGNFVIHNRLSSGGNVNIYTGDIINTSQWSHLVAVIHANGTIEGYINGQPNGEMELNILASSYFSGENFYVSNLPSGVDNYVNGFIDEVLIADVAFTSQQVEDLYNAQKDGFESGQYPTFSTQEKFTINAKDARTNTTLTNFTTTINGFEFESPIDIGIIESAEVNFFAGSEDNVPIPEACYADYPIRFTKTFVSGTSGTYRLNCFNYNTNTFENFAVSITDIQNATLNLNLTDVISSHLFLNDTQIIKPSINFLGKEKNYNILLEKPDYFPRTYANYNISNTLNAELFKIGEVNLFIRNLNNNALITDNVTITVENTNSQQILSTTTGTVVLENLQLNNNYQIKLESPNFDTSFQTIQYNGYIDSKTFFMQTNGTQVSVRVQDVGGLRLSNANVVIRSYVNGTLIDIQSKFSDVNGLATFILDTERTHLISVTKADYTALTNLLIDFTDTNIVVILDSTQQQVVKTPYDGITYSITPAQFSLNPNQLQNFSFSISSSIYNLSQFSLTLYNASTIIGFNGSLSAQGGIVTLNNINVSGMQNVRAVGAFTPTEFPQQTFTRTYFITSIERFNGSMLELRQRMASELTDIQRFVIFGLVFFITMIILSVFITGLNNILISMTMAVLFAWLIGMNMFFITAITFIVMLLLFALTLER